MLPDLVIEAVFEDLKVKQSVYADDRAALRRPAGAGDEHVRLAAGRACGAAAVSRSGFWRCTSFSLLTSSR